MQKYMNGRKVPPGANMSDTHLAYGFAAARTMEQVLRQYGGDLTRANIMKQAARLNDFAPFTLIPGIKVNTSATDTLEVATSD